MGVAERHEARVIWASNPALFALLRLGRFFGPLWRIPRLGWVVSDPLLARRVLADNEHVSLLGQGGVGHLWAQVLGDWVNESFDGPGHARLRGQARDLFNDTSARRQVRRVFADAGPALTARLNRGDTVDVAEVARTWVGRMVADLLGLEVDTSRGDPGYREIFSRGEQLVKLARRTMASTELPPEVINEASSIVEQLTAGVPHAYATAGEETLLGRCREAGIGLREARGLATVLLVAGTETAASAMARGVALLHDTGQQDALLARPDLMPQTVREVLRVTTPAPLIGRHVSSNLELSGRTLRRGDRVLMLTYTANNAVGRFDIHRGLAPKIRQLWFGAGHHLCLGAPLARAEITYLLESLLATGHGWRVVRRRAAREVVIPSYAELSIASREVSSGKERPEARPGERVNWRR